MKENRGGKRTGAGRKPSIDKKQTVSLYIETSKIEKAGGMEKMKERLYSHLNSVKRNPETPRMPLQGDYFESAYEGGLESTRSVGITWKEEYEYDLKQWVMIHG